MHTPAFMDLLLVLAGVSVLLAHTELEAGD